MAIDGTKMEANASLAANGTHEGLTKEIEKDVKRMLAEAEATDAEEDRPYGEKRRRASRATLMPPFTFSMRKRTAAVTFVA